MMKKIGKKQRLILAAASAFIIAASALVNFAPKLGLHVIPSWNQIYDSAGLYGKVTDGIAVHFISVGQGDSILLQAGHEFALVDGGPRANRKETLDYIKSQGVEKFKYVFATHLHEDHIGGLSAILEEIPAEKVVFQRSATTSTKDTKAYENLLLAVSGQGQTVTVPRAGDEFMLSGMKLRILSALAESEKENNRSLVIRASYRKISFLLTGDAEKEVETALFRSGEDLSAVILKLGHHGSKTSSTAVFLDKVKPLYAVVSCGAGNSFGHPNADVVKRVKEKGIELLRTDINGHIVFLTDGEKIEWKTAG